MASSPLYDKAFGGYRIFVGGLGNGRTDKHVLHTEFSRFGDLINVWVSRGPRAGFAFVVFMNGEDADVAVKSMDGRLMCGQKLRVEHARLYEGPPPRRKSESLNGGTVRRRSRSRDRRSRSRSPHHRRVHSRSRSRSHSHSRQHKSLSGTPTRSKSPAQSRPRSRSNSSAPNDTSK
ncbi:serine/arginine-rich splicing factor 3-like [Diadema setosum]|uniref:serine/arginine-rich splicing factor 3-like n=1 Tax=Diadema setosum TaxID=31175 RepID=UPI003B3A2977